MCELGNNRGIGIDPSYQPERTPEEFKQRVQFIPDYYGEKYSHITADVVLCRHTLEHIGRTGEFLRSIRRTIGDRTDTIVLFELPDVDPRAQGRRVLGHLLRALLLLQPRLARAALPPHRL